MLFVNGIIFFQLASHSVQLSYVSRYVHLMESLALQTVHATTREAANRSEKEAGQTAGLY